MKRKNKILEKIKFFFLISLFLSLVGGTLGLSITVFLEQQNAFNEIQAQERETESQEDEIQAEEKPDPIETNKEINKLESTGFYFGNALDDNSSFEGSQNITFKVGEDIDPGVYMVSHIDNTVGYYRVSTSSPPAMLEILDNDVFSEITYVKVNSGEYLTLISSELTAFEDINPIKLNLESVLNGRFLVGRDIDPGEYSLSPHINYGYVEITNNLRPSPNELVNKSYFDQPFKVILSEGQYIKVSAAYLKK